MSYEHTEYWIVDKNINQERTKAQINEAGMWIKKGEVVAFPTETVYGLGANAFDEQAVRKIFAAKGRPSDNPLIVHIAERQQLDQLVTDVSPQAERLIARFWPGPLTLIFKKKTAVAPSVTAGLDTVAVRMPDHPVASALLQAAGVPVAAPSANLSGKPSPTSAAHVRHDLDHKIAGIVDGGKTGVGLESTVLDCSGQVPVLYRPGGVTREEIEAEIGPVSLDLALHSEQETPMSPGMKYTHYAPAGTLWLVPDRSRITELVARSKAEGKRVGVLTTIERQPDYQADLVIACGKRSSLATVAADLYESLRAFDHAAVEVIYAETFPAEGVGIAIMNRLEKAAAGRML
ncbi:L-threonylcarbamoyladenylate synthase [Alkalihalobacillus oceani]|uniref:L-threonylcarbamoyladenylate synthase n=1 Tax=Halalkalibacter oceani TaxID=1653776 RepID=UPI00203EABB7|nr:L-threonylcarbamoyladenylate synthase [Halalkalibacter oceani]